MRSRKELALDLAYRGRFRRDPQVHGNADATAWPADTALLFQRLRQWAGSVDILHYWGGVHGKWIWRIGLTDTPNPSDPWFTVAILPPDALLPPLQQQALSDAPTDPADIPDAWEPWFPDPIVSLEARWTPLLFAHWAQAQGWTLAGVLEGGAPPAYHRPKTTWYLTGHPQGWIGVVEIFWELQVAWPPYGLPPTPATLPERPKTYRRGSTLRLIDPPTQLNWWSVSPTHEPDAPQGNRVEQRLEADTIERIAHALQDRPFAVVAFSGGKDSTVVLHLVLEAARRLSQDQTACPPIHVVSAQTGVDNPAVEDLVNRTLTRMTAWAHRIGMPVRADVIQPLVTDRFWVKVIGDGYTPPNRLARWCTRSLKIEPNTRYVETLRHQYRQHGRRGVLFLGVRDDESPDRAAANARRAKGADPFWADSTTTDWDIATPIRTWTTEAVFDALAGWTAPWGGDYQDVLRLYRHATGECPIALASPTPVDRQQMELTLVQQCGTQPGRTGCYTCTVVARDTSLERISAERDHQYAGHLRVQAILRAVGQPQWGLRTGWNRTGQLDTWKQGYGELDGVASAWLLEALAEARIWLPHDELTAIRNAWRRREFSGAVRIPPLGWLAWHRHWEETSKIGTHPKPEETGNQAYVLT